MYSVFFLGRNICGNLFSSFYIIQKLSTIRRTFSYYCRTQSIWFLHEVSFKIILIFTEDEVVEYKKNKATHLSEGVAKQLTTPWCRRFTMKIYISKNE